MSISNTLSPIQSPSCLPFPLCPNVTTETLRRWTEGFYVIRDRIEWVLNGEDNFALETPAIYLHPFKKDIEDARICTLRSMLFSTDTFLNPNDSDICNEEKRKEVKNFFETYLYFLGYIDHASKRADKDLKSDLNLLMNLFVTTNLTEARKIKDLKLEQKFEVLNLQMYAQSEKNDKEKLQSYLEGNQTQYKRELQDLKAANQKMNRFIFLSSFIGLLSTLFSAFIGWICYRKKQFKRCVDTSDNLQKLSLDEESFMTDNVSEGGESEKST